VTAVAHLLSGVKRGRPAIHRIWMIAYSPRAAAVALGIPRAPVLLALKTGDLVAYKIGMNVKILRSDIRYTALSGLPTMHSTNSGHHLGRRRRGRYAFTPGCR